METNNPQLNNQNPKAQNNVTLHPEKEVKENAMSTILGSKTIILGAIFVLVALLISLNTFLDSDSSEQYQGRLQQVEQETQLLQRAAE